MHQRGFSLVELISVVAVIGILAALAVPTYATYKARAFNNRAQSDLKNIVVGQEAAFTDNSSYTECSDNDCDDPAIPGVRLSNGVIGDCALFDGGLSFQCGFTHDGGNRIFYYTSTAAAFWDTPI